MIIIIITITTIVITSMAALYSQFSEVQSGQMGPAPGRFEPLKGTSK